jgi:hypothetical protein
MIVIVIAYLIVASNVRHSHAGACALMPPNCRMTDYVEGNSIRCISAIANMQTKMTKDEGSAAVISPAYDGCTEYSVGANNDCMLRACRSPDTNNIPTGFGDELPAMTPAAFYARAIDIISVCDASRSGKINAKVTYKFRDQAQYNNELDIMVSGSVKHARKLMTFVDTATSNNKMRSRRLLQPETEEMYMDNGHICFHRQDSSFLLRAEEIESDGQDGGLENSNVIGPIIVDGTMQIGSAISQREMVRRIEVNRQINGNRYNMVYEILDDMRDDDILRELATPINLIDRTGIQAVTLLFDVRRVLTGEFQDVDIPARTTRSTWGVYRRDPLTRDNRPSNGLRRIANILINIVNDCG